MIRSWHKFAACFLLSGAVALGAGIVKRQTDRHTSGHGHRQERSKNGDYQAVAAGYLFGTGRAEVTDDMVKIHLQVVTSDGRSSALDADLPTSGPYFSGQGTFDGNPVTIAGRLDAAKSSRLVATYFSADGRGGRIVASLPGDNGDESWDRQDLPIIGPGSGSRND